MAATGYRNKSVCSATNSAPVLHEGVHGQMPSWKREKLSLGCAHAWVFSSYLGLKCIGLPKICIWRPLHSQDMHLETPTLPRYASGDPYTPKICIWRPLHSQDMHLETPTLPRYASGDPYTPKIRIWRPLHYCLCIKIIIKIYNVKWT